MKYELLLISIAQIFNKAYLDYGGFYGECEYGGCDPNPNPYPKPYLNLYPSPYPNSYP